MGSLSHLRVLDLSRVLAGPWASQIFADLGAEVIKIERPGGGDDTRSWGPPWMPDTAGNQSDSSAYYLCTNRGKHSLAVALSDIMTGLYGTIGTLAALAERIASRASQHWLVGFEARNVPAGPINTIAEAFEQPQVAAREMLVNVPHPNNPALRLVGSPIKLSRTPVIYDRPPPRLGEDNSLLEMLTAPRVS